MFTFLADLASTAQRVIKSAMARYRPGCQPGDLGAVILTEIKNWEPKYNGQPVLTPALRAKLAGALGELAWNMASIDAAKKR